MRLLKLVALLFLSQLIVTLPGAAEVVYTPVNVSIPVGGYYLLDLNHDGVADFLLRSSLLQDYCQYGDGYAWTLGFTPLSGGAVVVENGSYAAALLRGTTIDAGLNVLSGTALMTQLQWGSCGHGVYGQWLNRPDRYLGVWVQLPGSSEVHYGWAKVVDSAYVDRNGHLQAITILQGFAYETVPGRAILAGQTTDEF